MDHIDRQPLVPLSAVYERPGSVLFGGDFGFRNNFNAEHLWRKVAVDAPEESTPEEHEELWTDYRKEIEYLNRDIKNFSGGLEGRGDEFSEHDLYGYKSFPYDGGIEERLRAINYE